jgi:hypothetical protein
MTALTIDQVKVGDELPPLSYEVTATTVVLGALAMRDWRPMHHDYKFATERNGTKDIFLNTPNQAHWFERFMTDWTGPKGRLARMNFKMKASVYPDDVMVFRGTVTKVETDGDGCSFADVDVALTVGEQVCTTCAVRIAIPTTPDDNPWARRGERWKP